MNIDTEADFLLEAYWLSSILVSDGSEKKEKHMLACVSCYADIVDPESDQTQLHEMLDLRDKFIKLYRYHPDGEVTIKLTIRQEYVNG